MLGGVSVARLTGSDEVRFSAAVDFTPQTHSPTISDPACCRVHTKIPPLVELCRSVSREANRRHSSPRQGKSAVQGGTKIASVNVYYTTSTISIFTATLYHTSKRKCRRNSRRNWFFPAPRTCDYTVCAFLFQVRERNSSIRKGSAVLCL